MSQPEARLQRKIQDELKKRGAFVQKNHGSDMMMAGLPDLVGCYRGYYFGFEVKMPGGKASAIQRRRLQQIIDAGGVACVVHGAEEALGLLDAIDSSITHAEAVRDRLSDP